jgi:hypothetical protein
LWIDEWGSAMGQENKKILFCCHPYASWSVSSSWLMPALWGFTLILSQGSLSTIFVSLESETLSVVALPTAEALFFVAASMFQEVKLVDSSRSLDF